MLRRFYLVTLAAVVLGCKSTATTGGDTPAVTPAQLDVIRAEYVARHPGTKVGVVSDVLKGEPYVAVSEIADLKPGEAMTFIDNRQEVLTHGVVRSASIDHVYVKIENPPKGGRAPLPGDLAVRFPSK